jgi:hypothetical protein
MAKYKVFAVSEPSIDNLVALNVTFPSGDFEARLTLLDQAGTAKELHHFYGALSKAEQTIIRNILALYLPAAPDYAELSAEVLEAVKPVVAEVKPEPVVEPIEEPLP